MVGVWVKVIRKRRRVAGVAATARKGETASGEEQPDMGASDTLCHRLHSVDSIGKTTYDF